MPEPVSSRAQAILDVVERVAGERSAGRSVPPPLPAAPLPPASARDDVAVASKLIVLVEQVLTATKDAHRRIDELAARVDALSVAGPALPPGAQPDPPPAPEEPPEAVEGAGEPPSPALEGAPVADLPGLTPPPADPDGPELGAPLPPIRPLSPMMRPKPPKDHVRRHSEPGVVDQPMGPSDSLGSTVRLVAIEMAVAGATRMEVETRLRDEFGLSDTRSIVDDVFGRNSAPGTRMPWGRRD